MRRRHSVHPARGAGPTEGGNLIGLQEHEISPAHHSEGQILRRRQKADGVPKTFLQRATRHDEGVGGAWLPSPSGYLSIPDPTAAHR